MIGTSVSVYAVLSVLTTLIHIKSDTYPVLSKPNYSGANAIT